jgi:methylated-DNA-[protein]-cysteine S-methyltransferase
MASLLPKLFAKLSTMKPQRPPTLFEQKVYRALKKIPAGKVTTYQFLAQHLRCRSAQAIGQALKRNPFAPQVPCHRVIRSDLKLGGYQGQVSNSPVQKKIQLLKKEGVHFSPQGLLLNPKQLIQL